ncbi:hypothetical protein EG329_012533 [Mollisiaceae sp. DMI_Dod_QoI]|nr:hypothetical protein EG329_012533 [Helotiales sp. DMI_Dod_QoI]
MAGTSKKTGTGTEDGEEGESSNLTQKQRRRAQVRKAQIEHRQRKENYVKHLEQDVINLREQIAQAETESVLFKHENDAIKSTLQKANLPVPPGDISVATNPLQEDFDFMDFAPFQGELLQSDFKSSVSPPDLSQWPTTSNSPNQMLISTSFDEWIDSTILQISPVHSQGSGTGTYSSSSLPETDIYNFPNAFTNPQISNPPPMSTANANQEALANLTLDASLSKPLPQIPQTMNHPSSASTSQPSHPPTLTYPDISTLAINFILALEHPCRTHFHPPVPFSPTSPPTGHELMASTLLYTSAPPSIYNPASNQPHEHASWNAPAHELGLRKLLDMSRSLELGTGEITPVQAWFVMVERYGLGTLLGVGGSGFNGGRGGIGGVGGQGRERESVLEKLKRALGKLVDCFHFGAVMDERRFWEVVEEELGVPKAEMRGGDDGKGKGKVG